jgi:hypothetical protein
LLLFYEPGLPTVPKNHDAVGTAQDWLDSEQALTLEGHPVVSHERVIRFHQVKGAQLLANSAAKSNDAFAPNFPPEIAFVTFRASAARYG